MGASTCQALTFKFRGEVLKAEAKCNAQRAEARCDSSAHHDRATPEMKAGQASACLATCPAHPTFRTCETEGKASLPPKARSAYQPSRGLAARPGRKMGLPNDLTFGWVGSNSPQQL